MEKKRLTKILCKASDDTVRALAQEIKNQYPVVVVKEPEKTLTMIKMHEPVHESLFYIGEVIVSEAIVTLGDAKGVAVIMGDNYEKVLNMAIIDAACNKGVFTEMSVLEALEKQQQLEVEKENAMFMKTMVNFTSMHTEP